MKKSVLRKSVRKQAVSALLISALTLSFLPWRGLPFGSGAGQVAAAVNGDGTDEVNEAYKRKLSLAPLAPAFHYDTMMAYDPAKDPDAAMNRATVPLAKRFQGVKINPLANEKARITSCAIMNWNHDKASSDGGDDFNVYAFDNWQLLDSLIYWAGTEEGIFALPSPDVVNAAHRNGVPVYATVGFPWGGGHADSIAELRKMCSEAFAEKMADIAIYYGFDGYFFNQETYGLGPDDSVALAKMLRHFKRYAKSKGHDLKISWYDSMANSGAVDYQNAVTPKNDIWMKPDSDGIYAVDEFFMNYNWGSHEVDTTVTTMNGIGRNPYDAYAGIEVQQRGYRTPLAMENLLDKSKQARISIALYAPNGTMGSAATPADFHKEEEMFYTGPQGDPSKADDSASWKGMARFVADRSPIMGSEFMTRFVAGHGKNFYSEGKVVRDGQWHNRSIQSIMPTWRWWVRDQKGSRVKVNYDFDDVWYGGNSLKLSGDFDPDSQNTLMLYSTDLDVTDNSKLTVTYEAKAGVEMALALSTEADYRTATLKEYPLKAADGWTQAEIPISELKGKKIHAFAIKLKNAGAAKGWTAHLGEIKLTSATAEEQNAVLPKTTEIQLLEKLFDYTDLAQARLAWKPVEGADSYQIWQVNNGKRTLLGESLNPYFRASRITREEDQEAQGAVTQIEVLPVNKYGKPGTPTQLPFVWPMTLSYGSSRKNQHRSENLNLGAKVTGFSDQGAAEPAAKAIDGTAMGNSKWCVGGTDSGWMSIDLGAAKTVSRCRVEHAETGGEAKDMNTVAFQLLYKPEGQNDWKLAKEINNDAQEAVSDFRLDPPIKAKEWKLNILDAGRSPWGAIRIYEWQMFESPELPKTVPIPINAVNVVSDDNGKGTANFTWVEQGSVVKIYAAQKGGEALATQKVDKSGALSIPNLDLKAIAKQYEGRTPYLYYTLTMPGEEESDRQLTPFALKGKGKLKITLKGSEKELEALQGKTLDFEIKEPVNGGERGKQSVIVGKETSSVSELTSGTYTVRLLNLPEGWKVDSSDKIVQVSIDKESELVFELSPTVKPEDQKTDLFLHIYVPKGKGAATSTTSATDGSSATSSTDATTTATTAGTTAATTGTTAAPDGSRADATTASDTTPATTGAETTTTATTATAAAAAADGSASALAADRAAEPELPAALAAGEPESSFVAETPAPAPAPETAHERANETVAATTEAQPESALADEENGGVETRARYAERSAAAAPASEFKPENYEHLKDIHLLGMKDESVYEAFKKATAEHPELNGFLDKYVFRSGADKNDAKLSDFEGFRFPPKDGVTEYTLYFDERTSPETSTTTTKPEETTSTTASETTSTTASETTSTTASETTSTTASETTSTTASETTSTQPSETTRPSETPSSSEEDAKLLAQARAELAALISHGNALIPVQKEYESAAFEAFYARLMQASTVYNRADATLEEIKEQTKLLAAALEELAKHKLPTESSVDESSSEHRDQPVIIGGGNGQNGGKHDKLPKTGERETGETMVLLLAAAAATLLIFKKREKREE